MSSHGGQIEVDLIHWTELPVPIMTMTCRRGFSEGRQARTTSTERHTNIRVVLLIEHCVAVYKCILNALTVDVYTFADLEASA